MIMLRRRFALPAILLGVGLLMLATAALVLTGRGGPATPDSLIGGPFRLTGAQGRVVTDADVKGKPFLVFFGYTHCPDVCPTTLSDLSDVLGKLGPKANVPVLFITVDPERDTPAIMADYVSSFDPRIQGLSGDRASIDSVLKEYRVYSRKVAGQNGDYTMDHSALVYLMDREGRFVSSLDLDEPTVAQAQITKQL